MIVIYIGSIYTTTGCRLQPTTPIIARSTGYWPEPIPHQTKKNSKQSSRPQPPTDPSPTAHYTTLHRPTAACRASSPLSAGRRAAPAHRRLAPATPRHPRRRLAPTPPRHPHRRQAPALPRHHRRRQAPVPPRHPCRRQAPALLRLPRAARPSSWPRWAGGAPALPIHALPCPCCR
jgi:hypothetical protein